MTTRDEQIPGQSDYPLEHTSEDGMNFSLDEAETPRSDQEWLALSKSMYETSQDYYEQSLQRTWETNARHFNSTHATGSKFYTDAYKYRSSLFRPLTRTTERNSSAATAAAMFSNADIVDVSPVNPIMKNASQGAAVSKALLQYRLENDVNWYLTAMGAWQDAFNYGPCIGYVHWEYEEREVEQEGEEILDLSDIDIDLSNSVVEMVGPVPGEMNQENDDLESQGLESLESFGGPDEIEEAEFEEVPKQMEVVKDKLKIDTIPVEYFRADPACDWRDVVNSSPYVIRLIPMYVTDIENKMASGEWKTLSRTQILASGDRDLEYDAVRRAREGENRADSIDDATRTEDTDFEVIFVHEYCVRLQGKEWVYYTLGTQALLTEVLPLKDVYFHGKRPFVYGFSVIEAHKVSPNGQSELIRPIQENVNDIANQRIDNIKLAMNKRYVVRRGAQVDLQALARNVPGGSVTADNPAEDVQVVSTPDVTSSSYEEVNRLTVEANEIAGSFSGSSVQSNRSLNETVGGMQLLSEGANQLQEFDIRTWVESWVKPVLNLAMLVVQNYETDEQIIAIAGQKGLEKFNNVSIDELFPNRDDLWNIPMSLKVNVGLGATAPFQRVQNLNTALGMAQPFIDPNSLDKKEIVQEIMAAAGFQDGSRFFFDDEEMAQNAQNNPPPPPPEVQAEQMKQQFEMQKLQMDQEFKAQMQQMQMQMDMQQFQMQLESNIKLKMAEIASRGDITMKQLEARMAEAGMNDKTRRDTVAVQEATKQNEMQLKREEGSGI